MIDLKELIEREIERFLDWPDYNKSIVSTASAKLFAEHVARLYAESKPAPDVAMLLALLDDCLNSMRNAYPDYDHYESNAYISATAALAAYRKKQGQRVAAGIRSDGDE